MSILERKILKDGKRQIFLKSPIPPVGFIGINIILLEVYDVVALSGTLI